MPAARLRLSLLYSTISGPVLKSRLLISPPPVGPKPSAASNRGASRAGAGSGTSPVTTWTAKIPASTGSIALLATCAPAAKREHLKFRSEERRVGKEGRARGGPEGEEERAEERETEAEE